MIWICALLVATTNLVAQIQVRTTFEPAIVYEGEGSIFSVEFSREDGSTSFHNVSPPRIPAVEGLEFRYLGPNQEIRIVNGRTSMRVSHLYRVRTTQAGEFKTPKFTVTYGDETVTVPSATIQVVGGSTQPSASPGSTDNVPDAKPTWLGLQLPRETLYVGETTPIDIRLFINLRKLRNPTLATEHPDKIGDAFTIGNYNYIGDEQGALDGLPVVVADWAALLTPLKTGPQPLLFELPVVASPRDASGRQDPLDSFFGSSPFRQMFSREEFRAYSEDQEIEILPLPTANRPDDFTGGIGKFQVEETKISSTSVQVGEPFLFSIAISGQGNFDRLEGPVFQADSTQWREYDPESSFTQRDELGYAGVKTFTFTLVPRTEGISATPDFTFSYFDPESAEYQTVRVPPTTIQVNPAPAGSLPKKEKPSVSNPVEARRGPDLLPLATQWSSGGPHNLSNPFTGSIFITVQSVLLLLLIAAWFYFRHRSKLRDDPDYARRSRARKASRRYLALASKHASDNETAEFFRTACRALQESVGPFQAGEPESLTETEVLAILRSQGNEESIQYSGGRTTSTDLSERASRLRILLRHILVRKSRRANPLPPVMSILIILAALAAVPSSEIQAAVPSETDAPAAESEPLPLVDNAATAKQVYSSAIDHYNAGDYSTAAAEFRSLLPRFSSEALEYNLGNTLYRLREYPEALLHYKRSFVIDPTNPDLRATLNLAREAASLEEAEPTFLDEMGHRLSWKYWTVLLCLGVWGLVATLLLSPLPRLPNLWRNCLVLLFGIILIVSGLAQYVWISTANEAIVLTEDAPLRIAPTASSPLESRLPAGSSVFTKSHYGDFRQVRLSDGTEGWILESSIARVLE